MKDAELTEADHRRLRETFEAVPFARLLGLELGELRRGSATLHLPARDFLKQNNGLLHGGATASLIDTAAAFAILTILDPGRTTTTIDLTIHYMRPLAKGSVTAHARVLRAGRRIVVVSVDVMNDSETIAATALTSYLRLS